MPKGVFPQKKSIVVHIIFFYTFAKKKKCALKKCNQMKHTSLQWIGDFLSLFYPDYCPACGAVLMRNERCVCTNCSIHLPRTEDSLFSPNPTERLFWGRVPVVAAAALFKFKKGGGVQSLIHHLKYKNRPDIGRYFGRMLGEELRQNPQFLTVDALVPIPLHPKKRRLRGYNQSEEIAAGIAMALERPVWPDVLVRQVATSTQTKRSALQRWENVRTVFAVPDPARIAGKHLLLVDDVITTGSTMEAAANKLLEAPNVIVSLAALAVDVV